MAAERVQKILAQAGIASRRKAEEMISAGLVTINGKIAKLGDKAIFGKDSVKVKGKLLHKKEAPVYLAFHKPKGVISMLGDPQGRPSLSDYLTQLESRVFPVGRLDFNSEGLLLLTNDGDMAEKLQKNEQVVRVYQVKVKGHPEKEAIERLEKGAKSGTKFIKPYSVKVVQDLAKKSRIEVVFVGGSAIDVKGLFEYKGFLVEKIVRVAIGHLTLRGIAPGTFKHLKASQMEALLKQPELGVRRIGEKSI